MERICTKCGLELPVEEFYTGRSECKECKKKWQLEYYRTNPELKEVNRMATKEWRKRNPERMKYLTRKWRLENKERCKLNRKLWRANNPEKRKAAQRRKMAKWRAKNKDITKEYNKRRRAARKGALVNDFTREDWQNLVAAFSNKCAYCGAETTLTEEHLVPLSRGGDHTLTNVVPACIGCNCKKGTKTALEYLLAI